MDDLCDIEAHVRVLQVLGDIIIGGDMPDFHALSGVLDTLASLTDAELRVLFFFLRYGNLYRASEALGVHHSTAYRAARRIATKCQCLRRILEQK